MEIFPSATRKFPDQGQARKKYISLVVQPGPLLITDNLPVRANNLLLIATNLLFVTNNLLFVRNNSLLATANLLL